jgi:hypothetical protein
MNNPDDLDFFYFAFGILRDTIWMISPRMKRIMLED